MRTRLTIPFLRGLAVLLPIAATIALLMWVFVAVDGLLKPLFAPASRFPGLGVLTLALIALIVGAVALWPRTKGIVERIENSVLMIPLVKLVYSPIKEFADALLGENKCFDKPVLVTLGGGLAAEVIGFVTKDDLSALGLRDKVAVYFPQSYTFGGNLVILPRERLTALEADSTAVMAFLLSGGVSGLEAGGATIDIERAQRKRALRQARVRSRFAR